MKKMIKKLGLAGLICALGLACFTGCKGNDVTDPSGEDAAGPVVENTEEANQTTGETTEVSTETDVDASKSGIDLSEAKLVKDGTLTVAMVVDYPPFEYYPSDDKTPIGVDVDIINAVAEELGLSLEIKDVPWDDNLFANMGTEYDLVCSAVTVTDERLEYMIFTDSYIDNYQSVVVRKDFDKDIDSLDSLKGLKVASQKDTISAEIMKEKAKTLGVQFSEIVVATDCFNQLINGEVDAIVCDSTVGEGQVERNPDTLKLAFKDEANVEHFAIAVAKDNEGLRNATNEALEVLQNNDQIKKIISDWFGR